MRPKFFLLLILVLIMCAPASAKYYQYTDKNGNVHYTDDVADVPQSQRPNVTTHESVTNQSDTYNNNQVSPEEQTQDQGYIENQQSAPENVEGRDTTGDNSYMEDQGTTENTGVEENQTPTGEQNATEAQPKKAPSSALWRIQARQKQKEINAKKAKLAQRYQELQDEKAQLGQPPPNDAPFAVQNAYYQKSKELTDKINQYQNDYQAVEKEVEAFNAQVSDRLR